MKYNALMTELGCAENPLAILQYKSFLKQITKYGVSYDRDNADGLILYGHILQMYEQSETKRVPLVASSIFFNAMIKQWQFYKVVYG